MIFHENRLLANLMKYHSLFFRKIREDVAKFVVCCNRDWRIEDIAFKTYCMIFFPALTKMTTLIKRMDTFGYICV